MRNRKANVADQLEYEDRALLELFSALEDPDLDRVEHGRVVKLFVERLAIRESAVEIIADRLARLPDVAGVASGLRVRTPERRRMLDRLEELTRGVAPPNIDQAQDVDGAIEQIKSALLADIEMDRREVLPAARRLLAHGGRRALPSSSYVLHHSPLHPGAHPVRWYEHVSPVVWIHAVYDYLRNLPVAGVKPRARVTIPRRGEVESGR